MNETPLDTYTTPTYMAAEYTGPWRRVPSKAQVRSNTRVAGIVSQFDPRLAHSLEMCAEGIVPCNRTRVCAVCTRSRERRMLRRYRSKLRAMAMPHFITVTTFPVRVLTKEKVSRTARAFSKLKRHARFRRAVVGGIACVEFKLGEHGWLVHIHAVVDLRQSLSSDWLMKAWTKLEGGHQVHVVRLEEGTADRAFTYILKRTDLPDGVEEVRQFVRATWGARLLQPFGNLHPLHARSRRRSP